MYNLASRKRTLSACGGSGTNLKRLRRQPARVRSCRIQVTLEFNDFSFCLIFSDKKRAPRFEMPALFLLIKILLVIVRVNCLDRAVFCDVELCELNASLVIASAGELGIVIEEIPFAVNLND